MMAKIVSNKRQLKRLVELLEDHEDLAQGLCSKPMSQTIFHQFAVELNKLGPPQRSAHKWQRVWQDLKCKVRKKAFGRGTCPPKPRSHFNETEELVVKILKIDQEILNTTSGSSSAPSAKRMKFEPINETPGNSSDDNRVEFISEDFKTIKNEPLSPPAVQYLEENVPAHEVQPSNSKICLEKNKKYGSFDSLASLEEDLDFFKEENEDEEMEVIEIEEDESPPTQSKSDSIVESHHKVLTDQIVAEKRFYTNMADCLRDIKRSVNNIEDYMKIAVDRNDELIQMKREKLGAYKRTKLNQTIDRNAKLELKKKLVEIQKLKLYAITGKSEIKSS